MRILTALIAAVLLGGCALSPQTITVKPSLTVAADNVGRGHSVSVLVQDNRKDATLGTRGGIYHDSSTIQSGNDVADAIRAQLETGLAAQGYAVTGTEAQTQLRVGIDELSYVVPEGAVAMSADITVALRVTATRETGTYETTYKSGVTRKFPVTPTAAQNEAWVNEVLDETLQRFYADTRMRGFLTAP